MTSWRYLPRSTIPIGLQLCCFRTCFMVLILIGYMCVSICIISPPKQALKAGKKVKLSHEEVMQKMGELFALR